MSDDDPESFNPSFPFSFTGSIPPFFTRSRNRPSPTFSTETPTDFPASTPLSTSFDGSSLPTPTQTTDPTVTDVAFPSSSGTLDTSTPTSGDSDSSPPTSTDISSFSSVPTDLGASSSNGIPLDSSITIDPSSSLFLPPSQFPTFTPTSSDDPSSTFSSVSLDSSFTTDSSSISSPSFTTSDLSVTPSSSLTPVVSTSVHTSSMTTTTSTPVRTSSPTPSVSPSSPTVLSQSQSSLSRSSSPSPVATTSFPSFAGVPQGRSSNNNVGTIVAATTGAIALAVILALLAILCRKRHLRKIRQRGAQDPFHNLDLDGGTSAVSQPLILGDRPGPGGAVYSDPYTDESRQRTQSRSFSATTGPAPSLDRSSHSLQAVVGTTLLQDPRGGPPVEYYNQPQRIDRRSPPPFPSPGIVQARPHQSLTQLQTKRLPDPPVARQSSPSFDAGAVAYLRSNDPTGPSPPSPPQFSPGNAEDHRLISAFSAGSGLSPQYSSPGAPPPSIDEMWRSSPDPVKASLSYRSPINRGHSFTPSVSGHVHEPGDTIVIAPLDPAKSPPQFVTSPGSDTSNPYPSRGEQFGSRPSPIPEVTEHTHSHEGSNNSGGTWNSMRSMDSSRSSPVVMHAHRVQLTPTALSLVSPPTPPTPSQYGESPASLGATSQLPPLPTTPVPQLPQVQPLSLGKKRSAQDPI